MAAVSTVLAACEPTANKIIATATSTLSSTIKEPFIPTFKPTSTLTSTDPPPPTAIPTLTLISVPEATPSVWKLSPNERAKMLDDPAFLKQFIKNQFDDDQYRGMKRSVTKENTCGQAALAAAVDIGCYFRTGKKDMVTTIASICNKLEGKTFSDRGNTPKKYINWNDSMFIDAFPHALQLLIPEYILKVESLTPDYDYGAGNTRIVPQSAWPDALSKAQTICASGGGIFIFCYKYGWGHIVLATDVQAGVNKDGSDATAIIGDSRSNKNGQLGTTQRKRLINYFNSYTDPSEVSLGQQPGLFNITGFTFD